MFPTGQANSSAMPEHHMLFGEDPAPGEERQRFIDYVLHRAPPVVEPSLVALLKFAPRPDKSRAVGSGALLRLVDTKFLVTAAHVGDILVEKADELVPVVAPRDGGETILLQTKSGHAQGDPYDIALFELADQTVAELERGGFKFLDLASLDIRDGEDELGHIDPSGGLYLVTGFPTDETKINPAGYVSQAGRIVAGIVNHAFPEYVGGSKIAVHFNIDQIPYGSDVPDAGLRGKDPNGMSGGAIWRAHRGGANALRWTPDSLRLVAIQYAWVKPRSVLVGTRIKYVVGLIYERFPDLRRIIDLAFPTASPAFFLL